MTENFAMCQMLTRAVHMALNSCLPPVVQLM